MKIAVGSDHGGFELKQIIIEDLTAAGNEVIDIGCNSPASVDYPDFAKAVALKVASRTVQLGIMIDGAGVGSCMVANKIKGIRAAVCNDIYTAGNAKMHNDANVLTLGSMVVGTGKAKTIVNTFINSKFEGGRHQQRVDKINMMDCGEQAAIPDDNQHLHEIIRSVIQNIAGNSSTLPPSIDSDIISTSTEEIPELVSEQWLRDQMKGGIKEILISEDTIITPLAADFARDNGFIIRTRYA